MKKVLLIVASQGYQPVEYGDTKKVLEDNKIEVVTGSDKSGQAYASDGSVTHVNVSLQEIDPQEYAGIFLIGGPGTLQYLDTAEMYNILRDCARHNKALGAICIAPRILACAGVLTGRKATGWDEDQELAGIFKEHGVHYTKEPVVVDGNVVTATGPRAAKDFGKAIVSVLK